MHFFRVKIGQDSAAIVEHFLEWQRIDGVSYIPVGGLSVSYISVSPEFEPFDKTGRVSIGDFRLTDRATLELVPQGIVRETRTGPSFIPDNAAADDRAFVVIPSGAYDFAIGREQLAVSPRAQNVALSVVLNPGETIKAMPKVRTMREWETVKPMFLTYHGCGRLTFTADVPAEEELATA